MTSSPPSGTGSWTELQGRQGGPGSVGAGLHRLHGIRGPKGDPRPSPQPAWTLGTRAPHPEAGQSSAGPPTPPIVTRRCPARPLGLPTRVLRGAPSPALPTQVSGGARCAPAPRDRSVPATRDRGSEPPPPPPPPPRAGSGQRPGPFRAAAALGSPPAGWRARARRWGAPGGPRSAAPRVSGRARRRARGLGEAGGGAGAGIGGPKPLRGVCVLCSSPGLATATLSERRDRGWGWLERAPLGSGAQRGPPSPAERNTGRAGANPAGEGGWRGAPEPAKPG